MNKLKYLFLSSVAIALVNGVELGPVGFNVYSDIYSRPQYGVSIRGDDLPKYNSQNDYILKEDALEILKLQSEFKRTGGSGVSKLVLQGGGDGDTFESETDSSTKTSSTIRVEYKMMSLNGTEYFCEIPREISISEDILRDSGRSSSNVDGEDTTKFLDGSENADINTNSDLSSSPSTLPSSSVSSSLSSSKSKALELLKPLSDTCLYYHAGYWTYSICYGQEITQFHASASTPRDRPPEPESGIPSYVLGKFDDGLETVESITSIKNNGEGGTLYASQLLGNGTECDLVDEHRTIEVQYLCNPKIPVDTIVLIKEVRTCHYRMVINTKRLCNELEFVPPKEPGVNEIKCRRVLSAEELVLYHNGNHLTPSDGEGISGPAMAPSAEDIMKLSGGLHYKDSYKLLDIDPPLFVIEQAPETPVLLYTDSEIVIPGKLVVDVTGTPIMEEYASTLEFIRDGLLQDIGKGFYSHKGAIVNGGDEFRAEDIHVLDSDGRLIAKATVSVSNGVGQVIITVDDEVDQVSRSLIAEPDSEGVKSSKSSSMESKKRKTLGKDGDISESSSFSSSSEESYSSEDPKESDEDSKRGDFLEQHVLKTEPHEDGWYAQDGEDEKTDFPDDELADDEE